MKELRFLILVCIGLAAMPSATAQEALLVFDKQQESKWKYTPKRMTATLGTQFAAGLASGFGDAIVFKYDQTFLPKGSDKFLGKTEQYWNPEISWQNKWKSGGPQNGERFPLSASALVSLTDAWHMADFLERTSLQASVFTYQRPGRVGDTKNWKTFFIDFMLMKLTYAVGFHLAQELTIRR